MKLHQTSGNLLLAFIFLLLAISSVAQTPDPNFPATDGTVNAMVRSGNTLYIGGTFNFIGKQANGGAAISLSTGAANHLPVDMYGVTKTVADGSGGWFISGSFTSVAGVARPGFAHIRADGSLDSFNPSFGSTPVVISFTVSGNTVFFSLKDNSNINYRVAAFDLLTGTQKWQIFNQVNALEISGTTLYLGGNFTSFSTSSGFLTRRYLAAVDAGTGSITAWNPDADGIVTKLVISNNTIFAAGSFSKVGGLSRTVAAIDASGAVLNFNPNVPRLSTLGTVAADNNSVYVGVYDSNGQSNIYRLNISSGAIIWQNTVNEEFIVENLSSSYPAQINAFAIATGKVFVGGLFSVPGSNAIDLVAYDTATGAIQPIVLNKSYGSINALGAMGDSLYVWGGFGLYNASMYRKLAAIDLTTDAIKPLNFGIGGGSFHPYVATLALKGNIIYAGGQFGGAGGQTRNNIAAIDTATGIATSWDANITPGSNNYVNSISISGNTVYMAGSFSSVGGTARTGLAAVDATNGNVTAWNPNPNYPPQLVAATPATVYVSGSFESIGGASRHLLAAIDATTGLATSWNPGFDGNLYSLIPSGNLLYVAGLQNVLPGIGPNKKIIAAINTITAAITPVYTEDNGYFKSMTILNDTIYSSTSDRLLALELNTGVVMGQIATNDYVNAIAVNGKTIYAGGAFTIFANTPRSYLAAINVSLIPPVKVSAGDITICYGGSGQLNAIASGGTGSYTYNWLPASGLSNASLKNPTVKVLSTTNYILTVTDSRGSIAKDTVHVAVDSFSHKVVITANSPTTFCTGGSVTLTAQDAQAVSYTWNTGSTNNFITVNSSGTYSVTSVSAEGCISQPALVMVTVNALPTGTITANGNTKICAGDSVRLSVNTSATSYLWSTGELSQSIWVKTAGNFSARLTSAQGCAANTNTITTTVAPLPTPSITQSGNVLTVAPSAVNYQWYKDGVAIQGATSSTLTIFRGGAYNVIVTDANGCSGSAFKAAVLRAAGSIPYQVYPNPSNSNVNIVYDLSEASNVSITISDVNGQRVIVLADNELQAAGEHSYVINKSSLRLEKGYYFITIQAGSKKVVQKIVIL